MKITEKDKELLKDYMYELAVSSGKIHEIVADYSCRSIWERELLSWEHCAMSFQEMRNSMSKEKLSRDGQYKCCYNDNIYIWGIGLEEPEVTNNMLINGVFSIILKAIKSELVEF